jgi:hypothetical protein
MALSGHDGKLAGLHARIRHVPLGRDGRRYGVRRARIGSTRVAERAGT